MILKVSILRRKQLNGNLCGLVQRYVETAMNHADYDFRDSQDDEFGDDG